MRDERSWHATDCQPIVSRRSIRDGRFSKRAKTLGNLVGATGFEPATPCAQARIWRCAKRAERCGAIKPVAASSCGWFAETCCSLLLLDASYSYKNDYSGIALRAWIRAGFLA